MAIADKLINGNVQYQLQATGGWIIASGAYASSKFGLSKLLPTPNQETVTFEMQRSYNSLLLFEAQRFVFNEADKAVKGIFKNLQEKNYERFRSQRDRIVDVNSRFLVQNQKESVDGYGRIKIDGNQEFIAKDIMGNEVPTALIMWYVGDADYEYDVPGKIGSSYNATNDTEEINSIVTKYVICYDLAPVVSTSSKKQVVATGVVGRDYSRKELIGNGDVIFNVSGKFVSSEPDVYPKDQVARFVNIMRYNGIVNVNNLIFGNHNVNQIIITDYSLPNPTNLNEQPYSFSCICVEPEDEVVAVGDTISPFRYEEEITPMEGWYRSVLANYIETAAILVESNVASSIDQFTNSKGL